MIQNATEELMQNLIEECSEVIKCITKIERFSHDSTEAKKEERVEHLKEEMVDVLGCIAIIMDEIGVDLMGIEGIRLQKQGREKLRKRIATMQFKPKGANRI